MTFQFRNLALKILSMKQITSTLILTTVIAFSSCKCTSHKCSEKDADLNAFANPDSLSEKQLDGYTMGSLMAEDLMKNGFDSINVAAFNVGFNDTYSGKDSLVVSIKDSKVRIRAIAQAAQVRKTELQKEKMDAAKAEGAAFLEANKSKPGVITTSSGLQYKILSKGIGAFPVSTDDVEVHYEGKLLNGEIFDSSYDRGQPISFNLGGVIKGWTEGMTYINEGGEIELYIPSELAYGERGAGSSIPPHSTLIFKVKLIQIKAPAAPQEHGPHDGHNH